MRQCAREILAQTRADRPRERTRMLQPAGECLFALGQPERLQHRLAAARVRADEAELAQVRHQHQAVASPIARHLLAHRRSLDVVVGRLHLDDTALRSLSFARAAPLDLLCGVEPEIGMARALVGELADAEHLGLERRADRVQKVRERPVGRSLPGRPARGADPPQIVEVRFDRRGQLRVRSAHQTRCRRVRPDMQALPPKRPWHLSARETPGKRLFGIGTSRVERLPLYGPLPWPSISTTPLHRSRRYPARHTAGPAIARSGTGVRHRGPDGRGPNIPSVQLRRRIHAEAVV